MITIRVEFQLFAVNKLFMSVNKIPVLLPKIQTENIEKKYMIVSEKIKKINNEKIYTVHKILQ